MKEHYTALALEIIKQAANLSKDVNAPLMSSEYILLALTSNSKTKSKLEKVGVTTENLAKIINAKYPPSSKDKNNPGFAKDANMVMERAFYTALQMTTRKEITIDILIMGILKQTESRAYRCLEVLAVDIPRLESLTVANIQLSDSKGSDDDNADSNGELASVAASGPVASPRAADKKTATLEQHATNLSQLAREGKLDPVIGRSKEIERVLQILARRTKNNPVLVGEPGVGKTAIIEGLAQELLDSETVPDSIRDRDVWSLDLGSLIAGTKYRGDFEQRLKKLVKEIQTANVIVFIDEIHALVAAGGGEGALNAANILKPVLARGEMQTIGATTYDEYRKYFEKDAAMARRFQQVDVAEPSIPEAIQILKGLRGEYEKHHNIVLTDKAIDAAVNLSARYVNDRFLPDKAIDLMDEAGARAKIARLTTPAPVKEMEESLNKAISAKEAAIEAQDFLTAAELRNTETKLRQVIADENKERKNDDKPVEVTDFEIAAVLTASTGIPVTLLTEDATRLLSMESELAARVIGQKAAIATISRSVRRQRAGLKDPNRPAGSFIFAGPTGVGKTELAKALAEFMFHDEDALITLDMSEYSEKHTVSRLFGAPPGFVGFEEGGQLTEKVRRKPYSVILFDEIEKAHPDVFNPLLQLLEEGRLTDGQGRVIDFKNTVIIMTTNLGARQLASKPVGFQFSGNSEASYEMMKGKVMTELKQGFKPEFLNRLDDIVVFPQLATEELIEIIEVFIARLNVRMLDSGLTVNLTDAAKEHVVSVGYDQTLGARPLRRAMQQLVEDAISEMMLFDSLNGETNIVVDYVDGVLTFNGLTRDQITSPAETQEV
jgi:ATP-dependent Clp protease ATP-binding subunit ClpC